MAFNVIKQLETDLSDIHALRVTRGLELARLANAAYDRQLDIRAFEGMLTSNTSTLTIDHVVGLGDLMEAEFRFLNYAAGELIGRVAGVTYEDIYS